MIYFIINNSNEISKDFFKILENLDLNYNNDILAYMEDTKILMIKNIIYILYDLYNSEFSNLLSLVNREFLFNLYNISIEKSPNDLLNYYKKSIINKYTN